MLECRYYDGEVVKMPRLSYSYLIYEGLRKAFFFGLRTKPIRDALGLEAGSRILDAGCGYGFFLKFCPDTEYIGIDNDPARIEWAKQNIGETENRKFILGDITSIDYKDNYFDKTIGYGLLHHLPDDAVKKCLSELKRVTSKNVVFSDPVYSKYHIVNNKLCDLDQGDYVRSELEYKNLCQPFFNTIVTRFFYSRNGLAKYYLQNCVCD